MRDEIVSPHIKKRVNGGKYNGCNSFIVLIFNSFKSYLVTDISGKVYLPEV